LTPPTALLKSNQNALCFTAADAELKRKVEAMHEGQAKIALLKNQSLEAEVALAGFILFGF
jgi:hypothetical protein